MLGSVPHFNLPRLPLLQYPRWGANTLNAWRLVVEPSEEFPIAIAVLASDPIRADAIIGSRWVVFDSVAGGTSVQVPNF